MRFGVIYLAARFISEEGCGGLGMARSRREFLAKGSMGLVAAAMVAKGLAGRAAGSRGAAGA